MTDQGRDSCRIGLFRGRFQPPGHQHAAVIMHFAETYGLDTIYIIVPDVSPWGRSPQNPFIGDEIREMWAAAFMNDYDTPGYTVTPAVQHTPMDLDILTGIDTALFFTREKAWARLFDLLSPLISWRWGTRLHTTYEPRNEEPYSLVAEQGYQVMDSATKIRDLMADDFCGEAADDWREYVPPTAAALIMEEYGEARATITNTAQQTVLQRHRKHLDQGIGWVGNTLR